MKTRAISLATCIALALLGLAMLAPGAFAGVLWTGSVEHAPQNMSPGDNDPATTEGELVVHPFDVGDAETEPNLYAIDLNLPPELTATDASWPGGSECTGFGVAGATVICTSERALNPPSPKSASQRGEGDALTVHVSIDPAAAGSDQVAVQIYGGTGGSCESAQLLPTNPDCAPSDLIVEPTPFGAAPAGFGFAPGNAFADVFDSGVPTAGSGGNPVRRAGAHPFEARVNFRPNLKLSSDPELGKYATPEEHIHDLQTRLPVGMIGNPQATPRCDAILLNVPGPNSKGNCPANTQVGTVDLLLQEGTGTGFSYDVPVYNMIPPKGTVAALAISFLSRPVWITVALDPTDHDAVIATVRRTTELLVPRRVEMTLWGVPGDPAHDALRLDPTKGAGSAFGSAFTGAPIKPFLTMPSQCDTPAGSIKWRADSWENPGVFTPWQEGPSIQPTGCDDPRFKFEPTISIQPTSHQAASPTGLDVDLSVPQKNDEVADADDLYAQNGKDVAINTPPVRNVVTRLPAGIAINPSAADGLAACSPGQIGLDDNDPVSCPDNSKLGTVEVETPLLAEPMHGFVYQATQGENPFGSTLALYAVAEAPGVIIKLPGKIEADPQTGQLTTSFSDNPQLPFSHFRLHIWGGDRAPLVNPPTCGTFQGSASVSSWNSSLPTAQVFDTAQITSGPGGRPCVSSLNARPFAPGFDAKSLTPTAGAFSAFALDVSRADGSQELSRIETKLPPGLIGRLAGIPYCPDASIAAIPTQVGSGAGERLAPHCPAASLVGHTDAGAGAGPLPFHNPGSVYLAGPYKGAPLSLAIVTPVIGGPLDLGNVVVRVALYVDPTTAQIRAVSDPLPTILAGIPLNLRSVRVSIDRPNFTLNPTSCEPMSVGGSIGSLQGATASVSDRFQVGDCAALAFKPKLALRLKGGTRRGDHPALRATLRMPAGGANIGRTSVALPHSEFLAQNHIRTVCTRVQFAAGAGNGAECPKGSIYGRATAVTPLLDEPLSGPVFLRSNPEHDLPDLVAALHGQIDVDLVGRIDSKNGGIRTTFDSVPDAPVSKFVLQMQGGRKGLLENSRNLCRSTSAATVLMDAHSGKTADSRSALKVECGGTRKRK